jgi:hypothetical protein
MRARQKVLVLLATLVASMLFASVSSASKVVLGSPFCSTGAGAGQCETPLGVAVNLTGSGGVSAGDVYVVDSGNDRIDEFSASGGFVRAFGWEVGGLGVNTCTLSCSAGVPSSAASGMSEPQGVAIDQTNGNLYVSDQANHRVDVFSATGAFEGAFGWGVISNSEEELQFCTTTTGCVAGLSGPGAGELAEEVGYPAVDPSTGLPTSGNIYIADEGNARVDEFKPTIGAGLVTGVSFVHAFGWEVDTTSEESFQICTTTCLEGENSRELGGFDRNSPARVAVDSSGAVYAVSISPFGRQCTTQASRACRVQKFNAAATSVAEFAPAFLNVTEGTGEEVAASDIAIDQSTNDVYVVKGNEEPAEHRILEFESNGTLLGTDAEGAGLPAASGLAFGTGGRLYLSSATNNEIYTVGPPPPPTVTIAPITSFGSTVATFDGEVTPPGNFDTTYQFEYSTNGTSWTKVGSAVDVGSGSSTVTTSQNATGLSPNTFYDVRLEASDGTGAVSATTTFTTSPEKPFISQTLASPVEEAGARLTAYVNPNNSSTSYYIQYGTSTSYGHQLPAFERSIGGGAAAIEVIEPVSGLQPDTEYHFRVVATNAAGVSEGPDQTFTTLGATGRCPNEQVRSESDLNPETGVPFSLTLPECRAYEMVSPPLKNGAPIISAVFKGTASGSIVTRFGAEGSTVLIQSTGIWPGGEQPGDSDLAVSQGSEAVRYRSIRDETGWGFTPEVPPASDLRGYEPFITPAEADTEVNGIWKGFGYLSAEQGFSLRQNVNFYLLEPDGALAEIGPSAPHSAAFTGNEETEPAGASADLSDMLFSVTQFRWPFDQTKLTPSSNPGIPSLYEYIGTGHTGEDGDVPALVGVDNTGVLISQCGTEPGRGSVSRTEEAQDPEARSISAGGSTVIFTALAAGSECAGGTGPAVNQLFARIGEPGPGTAVGSAVTVNVASTETTACEVSDSCNVTQAVKYQGASTDGSKVFFTSEQPLIANDTDSTNNLYECDGLPGDSGAPLTASRKGVNPCPNLVRVSVPTSGSAEVQSVAAVSQDGSHVYFIATGVLSGENAEHDSPAPGEDNLYVWTDGHTAFIATLPSATLGTEEGEGGQATPGGDAFAFTTAADLTPDDTSTVNQVFLYEAQHEALIRVSKGQDGFNDNGNTSLDPAKITPDSRRAISEDGSTVVFQSSDALTPDDHGGRNNVYLWRGGNVYLISDGTPAGEKSGLGEAGLVGIDASGQNVFFTTEAQLVGQDSDELSDLYDARIDGGFPAPKVNECSGEACQGALSGTLAPAMPGSLLPSGAGDLMPVKSTLKSKPKFLTRAQKLAKALKACARDKSKVKRAKCVASAHKRYGVRAQHRQSAKARPGHLRKEGK